LTDVFHEYLLSVFHEYLLSVFHEYSLSVFHEYSLSVFHGCSLSVFFCWVSSAVPLLLGVVHGLLSVCCGRSERLAVLQAGRQFDSFWWR
jgi:hypothetical protein